MLSPNPIARHLPSAQAAPALLGAWRRTLQLWATYGLVGGSSTLIDFALFNLLVWLVAPSSGLILLLASAISAFASSLNSYTGHRRWTFKRSDAPLGAFLLLNALTLGLNMLLVLALTSALPQLLTVSSLEIANLSKGLAIGGSGLAGYLGNKYWVFGVRG